MADLISSGRERVLIAQKGRRTEFGFGAAKIDTLNPQAQLADVADWIRDHEITLLDEVW